MRPAHLPYQRYDNFLLGKDLGKLHHPAQILLAEPRADLLSLLPRQQIVHVDIDAFYAIKLLQRFARKAYVPGKGVSTDGLGKLMQIFVVDLCRLKQRNLIGAFLFREAVLNARFASRGEDRGVVDEAFPQLGSLWTTWSAQIDRRRCDALKVLDVQHADSLWMLQHVLNRTGACDDDPAAIDLEDAFCGSDCGSAICSLRGNVSIECSI